MRLWFVLYPDVRELDGGLVEALVACRGDLRCAVTARRFASGDSVRRYARYENGVEVDVDERRLAGKPLYTIARALYALGVQGVIDVDERRAMLLLNDALELVANIYATSYGVNPATWKSIEPHPASANDVARVVSGIVARLYRGLAEAGGRISLRGAGPVVGDTRLRTIISNEGGIVVEVGGYDGRRVLEAAKGGLRVVVGGGDRQLTRVAVYGEPGTPPEEVARALEHAVRALMALERGDVEEYRRNVAYFDTYEVREGRSLPPTMNPVAVKLLASALLGGLSNEPDVSVSCEGRGCVETLLGFAVGHPYLPFGDVAAPERGGISIRSAAAASSYPPGAAETDTVYWVVAEDGKYTEYIGAFRPRTLHGIDVSIVEEVGGRRVFTLNTNDFGQFSVFIDTRALPRDEQIARYALFARMLAGVEPARLLNEYRPRGVAKIAVCSIEGGCVYAVKTPRGWERIEVYPGIRGVDEAMAWPDEVYREARRAKAIALLPKRMDMKAAIEELLSVAKRRVQARA